MIFLMQFPFVRDAASNLQVLCEHLHLPKAWQVEFKARIIALTFAVNSTWQATGTKPMLQQMQKCMKQVTQQIVLSVVVMIWGDQGLPEASSKRV